MISVSQFSVLLKPSNDKPYCLIHPDICTENHNFEGNIIKQDIVLTLLLTRGEFDECQVKL